MMTFFENKTDAVEFAKDLQEAFPKSLPSITTITPEKFVVCFAPTVINGSLDDTDTVMEGWNSYLMPTNT